MTDNLNFSIEDDKAPASAAPKKRGPGRPKGSTNAAKNASATAADVRQAMATLESLYDFTAAGLVMFGFNDSAASWVESAARLKATNEDALKAAPKLAATIARMGQTGGTATFIIAHVMAVSSLLRSVQGEVAERRRAAAEAAERPDNVSDFPGGVA